MDRVLVFGTSGGGPIPPGSTEGFEDTENLQIARNPAPEMVRGKSLLVHPGRVAQLAEQVALNH